MNRLVVVSNRVRKPGSGAAQGGLAIALSAALREHSGFWFGWSGESCAKFSGQIRFAEDEGVKTAVVDLEEQDVHEYYNGFANRTLWPLFHYRIDLAEYDRSFGEGYERVNRRFADTVLPLIEPDDVIWVHDYHLFPLGFDLRRAGCDNRMGFFLHIPWPPTRLLVSLPHHRRLVLSMFAYDVVGFQTEEWLESFRHYCEKEMDASFDGNRITVRDDDGEEQTLLACACPIGIDFKEFTAMAEGDTAKDAGRRMRASLQDRKLLVGVDRLDYSKGLEERFEGIDRFLQDEPQFKRQAVMVQIAPPSRGEVESYREIRATLDSLTGRINGKYADVDWTPIRYVNQGYRRDQLAGIYRAAQVGLVTPLRDGMNLVAKEFVAAQDPEDPGVLILSRFAGAALQLPQALLINPYSAEEMSDAIRTALEMPLDERKERWRPMYENVRDEDVIWWRKKFTSLLLDEAG